MNTKKNSSIHVILSCSRNTYHPITKQIHLLYCTSILRTLRASFINMYT